MASEAHSDIQPGQRFQQNRTLWEVVEFKSLHEIPHVRIMQVGDTNERKLISVSALRHSYNLAPV